MVSLIYSMPKRRILIFSCYGTIIGKGREWERTYSVMGLVTYATLTTCIWIDLWGCRFCCVFIKVLFDFKVLLITSIPEFFFSKIKFYSPQSTGVILQKFCWNLCVITFSMCKVYWGLTGFLLRENEQEWSIETVNKKYNFILEPGSRCYRYSSE